jgi:outer membrane receptor protein involved in Fe transport
VVLRNQTSSLGGGCAHTGKHNLSVGGDFRRIQINSLTDQNARGIQLQRTLHQRFQRQWTTGSQHRLRFHRLHAGPSAIGSVRFGSANTYFRGSVYDAYATDDWRLRSNLTLIVGLRYEYFTPYTEKYNKMANLDIAPNLAGVAVVLPGQTGPYSGSFPDALINPEKNAFSPRIGLAWRPTSKGHLLVRSGYGMFYNGSIYNQFVSRLASQPPFASTATLTNSLANPLTLQNGFPVLASSSLASNYITNTYAVDPNYRMPYAQTWNLSISREFPRSIIVELGYLGRKVRGSTCSRFPTRPRQALL